MLQEREQRHNNVTDRRRWRVVLARGPTCCRREWQQRQYDCDVVAVAARRKRNGMIAGQSTRTRRDTPRSHGTAYSPVLHSHLCHATTFHRSS